MEKIIDQKLIQGILLDENDFYKDKLYKKYKEYISKYLRKKYPSNIEHDDDVSEILTNIFENLSMFDSEKSKFSTWTISIARNYMINKFKKNKPAYVNFVSTIINDYIDYNNTGTLTNNSYLMFEPMSLNESPYQLLENNDALDFISDKIGIENFSMISMKNDGYNYHEIGTEFNLNDVQVSNKINYSKSKLKKK